ncbi:DUF1223 domain-containing protein [Prosthecomicrobium pneumaticum]|uniref:DUF1223 domain-containing protein n=1 Tax=Prosthecomicrobium pneumaticum TaxID=81895 RepID=A0A7W9FMP8_9HYPH|nr:DUF1223 domain-containing protein [Prosthecomicrobium pneumaticum]MBB5753416.1 hypothetical protein [Prosthecomicrobium pneumaticum]
MIAKRTWAVALGLCAALVPPQVFAEEPVRAVVELFTSQGCSSCPPADALLGEYAARDDIVALSLPIDYWDYLGWPDTLSEPEFTERQRAYSEARGDRQVFTPQMVVNGGAPVVGGRRAAVDAAIARSGPLPVPITVTMAGDAIRVAIGAAPPGDPARGTLWLALYDRRIEVTVGRGENSGRTLPYYNVVRKLRPIAMWDGRPMTVDLPISEYRKAKADGCAVLLQTETAAGQPGRMLGAAHIEHHPQAL